MFHFFETDQNQSQKQTLHGFAAYFAGAQDNSCEIVGCRRKTPKKASAHGQQFRLI